ncbi:MAG: type II CRISPR RNA-guided endonuclease Cas9, partial [Bacteroidales bacterium]
MTKILGLDLGTNSIGWAIVDKENSQILDSGVRIFPAGVKDIGQGEKEQSKNAERRQFRMSRRLHFRKRLRKIKLLEVLIEHQMCPLPIDSLKRWKNWNKVEKSAGRVFPSDTEFTEWLKMNPYKLREKAVKEPITRLELGRIFYHFIQRRGFLSTRKGSDEGAIYKGKENVQGINATRELIQNKTLGQQLSNYLPNEHESYKRILDENGKEVRVRARYTLRRMYVEEFQEIWEKQANHLGLNELWVKDIKSIFLKGSPDSNRNQSKIQQLKNKHGEENVNIESNRILVHYKQPFKNYIAGDIKKTDEGIRFKSNESVLFWQRPLRSQKALLGKCTFESRKFFDKETKKNRTIGASPVPVSHPDFELFRSYQFINNIRLGSQQIRLNNIQRVAVLDVINKNDGLFDFKKIPDALNLTHEHFNYDNDFKVAGNTTHKKLKPYFSEEQWEKNKYDIWHCFYFFDSPEMLSKKLQNTYGLTKEKADKASKIQLKPDYGNVSLKAVRNILPFLEMGFIYSTAVVLGGVRNAFGARWDHFKDYHDEIIKKIISLTRQKQHKEYELIAEVKNLLSAPENNYGFTEHDRAFRKLYHHSQTIEKRKQKKKLSEIENLRNPIVQKGLNEMRRLVNELLDKYSMPEKFGPNFEFDSIHVELGRNLRSGKQQRREMMFKIRENEKANEEGRTRLAEYGLKPSRENITKFRLFKEIEDRYGRVVCPYTNMSIKIS